MSESRLTGDSLKSLPVSGLQNKKLPESVFTAFI